MKPLDLDIFIEGEDRPIGRLERGADGSMAFRYLNDPKRPISLSLPLREEPFGDAVTRGFFSNLLFENAQREQIMQRYGLDFNDITGLLAHLGADCPGAISCVPRGQGPAKVPGKLSTDYDILSPDDLLRIMSSLRDRRRVPDGIRDPSPLAGVQGKIALTRLADGRFALPKNGLNVPTTHILKVPRPGEMVTVDQENLLMSLMVRLQKHEVAATEIFVPEGGDRETLRGLLVTRFDRRVEEDRVHRIHQEDFAQAAGLGPHLKYERNGEGGRRFSAKTIGWILGQTARPGMSRQAFLDVTIASLALGNTDNHAKNYALIHDGAKPRLAPVYDVTPTIIDQNVLHQLAFDIGAAKMTDEITGPDLDSFIAAIGFPRATPALRDRLRMIVKAAAGIIPDTSGPSRKRIGDAIAEQVRPLAAALGMGISIPERDAIILNRP